MLGRSRTAVKFFVYGLAIGLLFAPRSGEETRSRLIGWIGDTISGTMKGVSGGNEG